MDFRPLHDEHDSCGCEAPFFFVPTLASPGHTTDPQERFSAALGRGDLRSCLGAWLAWAQDTPTKAFFEAGLCDGC